MLAQLPERSLRRVERCLEEAAIRDSTHVSVIWFIGHGILGERLVGKLQGQCFL